MKKFSITTSLLENYAAHNGFNGKFSWKPKAGSTYVVHAESREEAEEVRTLIEVNDNYFKRTIETFDEVADDFESEIVKWQRESGCSRIIYVDDEIKKGKDGHWYRKRGHIGTENVDPKYSHLIGKFCGWVDDLTLGKVVLTIEGDKRERVA